MAGQLFALALAHPLTFSLRRGVGVRSLFAFMNTCAGLTVQASTSPGEIPLPAPWNFSNGPTKPDWRWFEEDVTYDTRSSHTP